MLPNNRQKKYLDATVLAKGLFGILHKNDLSSSRRRNLAMNEYTGNQWQSTINYSGTKCMRTNVCHSTTYQLKFSFMNVCSQVILFAEYYVTIPV